MNGFGYLYPKQALPFAWQGLTAWERVTVAQMGGAFTLEQLACMEADLSNHPDPKAKISGAMIPVAVDCYCREGDLLSLQCRDVTVVDSDVILHFGQPERGESTKTGRQQGVRVDSPYVADIVRARIATLAPSEQVFPITASDYQKWWWWLW